VQCLPAVGFHPDRLVKPFVGQYRHSFQERTSGLLVLLVLLYTLSKLPQPVYNGTRDPRGCLLAGAEGGAEG
jgi:hypothetical protein